MSKLKETSLFGFLSHSTANAPQTKRRRLERGSSDESPGPTNSNEFDNATNSATSDSDNQCSSHFPLIEPPQSPNETYDHSDALTQVTPEAAGSCSSFSSNTSITSTTESTVMLSELNHRLSTCNLDLMKSLDACNPLSPHFLDCSLLASLASSYGINDRQLNTECIIAKGSLSTDDELSIEKIYFQLLSLPTAFPTLTTLFKIAMTIVVSTAQCERSFSAMSRIRTHLRTTMLDQRLADISLLSLERDLTTSTNFIEDTIKDFDGMHKNRTIVLS
uniref:HAT C-terminal dimerisation domain-containing protein n=1 Tax=Amphimedon queenslandica TaxID=400682 RepID=A0A1X7VWC3_AMPQE